MHGWVAPPLLRKIPTPEEADETEDADETSALLGNSEPTSSTTLDKFLGIDMPTAALGWHFLVPVIAVWYSFSLLAIYSAKIVLDSCQCAATLCALQLGAATLGCQLVSRILPPSKDYDQHGRGPATLATAEYRSVCAIAVSYSCGFLLTNAAIELASPAFVETVKSGEPLSTVALAAVILGERESLLTLCLLVPLVMGIAMASGLGEGHVAASFSAVGMALALASNLSFSWRAIATKQLQHLHPTCAAVRSDLVLFYHVSRLGMLFVLPIAGLFDAQALLRALLGVHSSGAAADDGHGRTLGPHVLLLVLLSNCVSHALYNAVSFAVLNRVSVASHAVLNIVRRVFMIGGTALIFGTPISGYNWLGIAICVVGCLAFAYGKEAHPLRMNAASRAHSARLHYV